jgi:hypothetical protein
MRTITKLFVILSLVFFFLSCNSEFYPLGESLLVDQTLESKKESIPAFTFQKKLKKVQSTGFPLVQLGSINHPVFGKAEASFTLQLSIANNPYFGNHRQQYEDENDGTDPNLIPENEVVKEVYLEIPFFTNRDDADNDGVIDSLDSDPNDPQSNSDNDELTDIIEFTSGLNPLSSDSDGDGILDHLDNENDSYISENKVYQIDSIYGNKEATFDLKIYELTYYLNDLDASNNFETSQIYYSNRDYFEEGFYGTTLFDDNINLNLEEVRFNYVEDDPETLDIDEITQVETRLTPRFRIPLDPQFFQEKLIDLEGSSELETNIAFQKALRGLIIKTDNFSSDLYMLLDIENASINISYEYDDYQTQGTLGDTTDDLIEKSKKDFTLNFNGIRINTLKNSAFDAAIEQRILTSNQNIPSDKLYIQSGSLLGKVRLFDEENPDENELINEIRAKSWLINEANLVFYIDPENTSPDKLIAPRLYLYKYDSGQPLSDYINDGSVSNYGVNSNKKVFGGLLEYDENNKPYRYRFNITDHISNVIRYDSLNVDLAIVVSANINDVSSVKATVDLTEEDLIYPVSAILNPLGTILVGSHPETIIDDKKLKLELFYSSY